MSCDPVEVHVTFDETDNAAGECCGSRTLSHPRRRLAG
jgi:hypothetical protein